MIYDHITQFQFHQAAIQQLLRTPSRNLDCFVTKPSGLIPFNVRFRHHARQGWGELAGGLPWWHLFRQSELGWDAPVDVLLIHHTCLWCLEIIRYILTYVTCILYTYGKWYGKCNKSTMCWLEALEAPWSPSFDSSMFPPETKCVVFARGRMDELRSFAQGCIRVLVAGPAVAEGTWTPLRPLWSRKLEARLSKDPSYPNVCPDSYAWSQI